MWLSLQQPHHMTGGTEVRKRLYKRSPALKSAKPRSWPDRAPRAIFGTIRPVATLPLAPSSALGPRSAHRWRSRTAEFLLVGGVTPFLFPLAWLLRRCIGLDASTLAAGFITFYAAHVINDPHFSVTYLLFYRDFRARAFGGAANPPQRARYLLAGVVVPLALSVWAVASIAAKSAFALGLMIQLMFFLVGWHYVKQGFGVMSVLAARRGVRFSRRERWTILAHCFAGWAYAWASPADGGTEVEEKGVVYTTIAHSRALEHATLAICVVTAVVMLGVLLEKRLREGPLHLLSPLVALLSTIWSWSIYSSIDPVVVYLVPALHSVQYLYFVWLMRSNEAHEREGPPWFDVSARVRMGILAVSAVGLGWILFHFAPAALDDMLFPRHRRGGDGPLGPTPCFAAIFAFVNIHHYFMDWVIWRRDNPQTRYLLA